MTRRPAFMPLTASPSRLLGPLPRRGRRARAAVLCSAAAHHDALSSEHTTSQHLHGELKTGKRTAITTGATHISPVFGDDDRMWMPRSR